MPNTKISNLTSAGALAGTEVLPIVQTGSTVKTTVQDIANLASGGFPTALISFEFPSPGSFSYTVEFNNTGSNFAFQVLSAASGVMRLTSSLAIINSGTFISMNPFRDTFNFPTFKTVFLCQASVNTTTQSIIQLSDGDGANYNLTNTVTGNTAYLQVVFYV